MRRFWFFVFTFGFSTQAFSQGCSDAGFCTIPDLAPAGNSTSSFHIDFKASLEATEPGALLFVPQIWLNYKLTSKVSASVKIPFWFVNDADLGANNSISDPIISLGFNLLERDETNINFTLGTRIGINNANVQGTMGSLPMDYQSSLGTTDLIVGINSVYQTFSGSLALQFPIWQYNENQNVVLKYLENDDLDSLNLTYKRNADLMLRIDKKWQFNNWGCRLGILPIFHLANDELISNSYNGSVEIEGSAGVTINIPLGVWYNHKNWTFGLDLGFPVVTRTERPDGLTRKYVAQPRISYNFN